jgi:hypothetical protein
MLLLASKMLDLNVCFYLSICELLNSLETITEIPHSFFFAFNSIFLPMQ